MKAEQSIVNLWSSSGKFSYNVQIRSYYDNKVVAVYCELHASPSSAAINVVN